MNEKKIKTGLGTTEFWMMVGGLLSANAAAFSAEGDESIWVKIGAVVADVVVPIIYGWLRTKVKTS